MLLADIIDDEVLNFVKEHFCLLFGAFVFFRFFRQYVYDLFFEDVAFVVSDPFVVSRPFFVY